MDISPNALRKEVVATLRQIEDMMDVVEGDDGLTEIQRASFHCVLLSAKAQSLNTLVLLQEKK